MTIKCIQCGVDSHSSLRIPSSSTPNSSWGTVFACTFELITGARLDTAAAEAKLSALILFHSAELIDRTCCPDCGDSMLPHAPHSVNAWPHWICESFSGGPLLVSLSYRLLAKFYRKVSSQLLMIHIIELRQPSPIFGVMQKWRGVGFFFVFAAITFGRLD